MDPLVGFLDGPRARSAFLLRCLLDPPWSISVEDRAPLAVTIVAHGRAWFVPAAGDPVSLGAGDVLIARGPEPYLVADDPATAPTVVIDPGELCRTPDGEPLEEAMTLGVRTWGNSASGQTALLVGTYLTDGEVSRVLLDALPDSIVVRGSDLDSPVAALLAAEIVKNEPGQQAVLDRLLDLVLVGALRVAFARDAVVPRWYRASSDPIVGPAIRLMQGQPAEPWTVAALAAAVGTSRANLARRFNDAVGQPPMAFLAAWRMALAADRLLDPGATVTRVAAEVGYTSPFTFSSAFKRHYGTNPRAYRNARVA